MELVSKKNRKVLIRYPKREDALRLLDYVNALSKEKTFVKFQGEQLSIEEEKQYLESALDKISRKQLVILLALYKNEIIGKAGLEMCENTAKHIGRFHLSVARSFRGEGIGWQLMDLVIKAAIQRISSLELIELFVFSNNDVARKMYEKFGFTEYARLPRGIKLESNYVDRIQMYKMVSRTGMRMPAKEVAHC